MSAAVAALAMVADGGVVTALVLAAGMFGFQVSIGALNDLVDADRDRLAGADKPIPAGLVSRRVAMVVVVAGASTGLAGSASFGGAVLLVGLLGAGSGYAYDLVARRAGLGWITFAVALPALLVWVWLAAAGTLPPESMVLLPLAALAGPAVHLANSMADTDDDQQTGATSLATRLGPHRSRRVLVGLDLVIWALAWLGLVLLAPLSAGALLLTSVATVVAGVGALASISARTASSDLGWTLGALALAMVAVIWVATLGTA